MASEFLRLKAAEQAKRAESTSGVTPHIADKQRSTQQAKETESSSRASTFLRNKAEEQARWASVRYG